MVNPHANTDQKTIISKRAYSYRGKMVDGGLAGKSSADGEE